jgi:hypothetical protein
MLINVDVSVCAMYVCPYLVLALRSYTSMARYAGGPLPDVALSALGGRNRRELDFPEGHANFRKLKSFLKNLFVIVTIGNASGRKKKIRGLVAKAGNFMFDKNGTPTTVKVCMLSTVSFSELTIYTETLFGGTQI